MDISGLIDCWFGLIISFLCRGRGDSLVKDPVSPGGGSGGEKKFPMGRVTLPFRAGLWALLAASFIPAKNAVDVLEPRFTLFLRHPERCLKMGAYSNKMGFSFAFGRDGWTRGPGNDDEKRGMCAGCSSSSPSWEMALSPLARQEQILSLPDPGSHPVSWSRRSLRNASALGGRGARPIKLKGGRVGQPRGRR